MKDNKNKGLFKRGKLGYRILIISFVFIFILIAELSPFIFLKDANMVLAIILVSITAAAYILIILLLIWDHLKTKYNVEDKDK